MSRWVAGLLSLPSIAMAALLDSGTPIIFEDRDVRTGGDELAASVAVSPDGRHVYATRSNLFPHDGGGLTVFERNVTTGTLSVVEELSHVPGTENGLRTLRAVFVSPDGAHLYVGGVELLGDDSAHETLLNTFSRDPSPAG